MSINRVSDGTRRIGIYAKQFIPALSELTLDYGWDELESGEEEIKCLCNAKNCRGTLHKVDKKALRILKRQNLVEPILPTKTKAKY